MVFEPGLQLHAALDEDTSERGIAEEEFAAAPPTTDLRALVTPVERRGTTVFLSYARVDDALAHEVMRVLTARGHKVVDGLLAEQSGPHGRVPALMAAEAVVAIVSKTSLGSRARTDDLSLSYVANKCLFIVCPEGREASRENSSDSTRLGPVSFRLRLLMALVWVIYVGKVDHDTAMGSLVHCVEQAPIKIERARADGEEDTYGGEFLGETDPRVRSMYSPVPLPFDIDDDFWVPHFLHAKVVSWEAFHTAVRGSVLGSLAPIPDDLVHALMISLGGLISPPNKVRHADLLKTLACETKGFFSFNDLANFILARLCLHLQNEVCFGSTSTVARGTVAAAQKSGDPRLQRMIRVAIADQMASRSEVEALFAIKLARGILNDQKESAELTELEEALEGSAQNDPRLACREAAQDALPKSRARPSVQWVPL